MIFSCYALLVIQRQIYIFCVIILNVNNMTVGLLLLQSANMMRCDHCGWKHKRVLVDRAWYSARYCERCHLYHSAKEVSFCWIAFVVKCSALGKQVGLLIKCFDWGRGLIPTPGIYSAAIAFGKGLTLPLPIWLIFLFPHTRHQKSYL